MQTSIPTLCLSTLSLTASLLLSACGDQSQSAKPAPEKPQAAQSASAKPAAAKTPSAEAPDDVMFWGNYMDVFNTVFPRGSGQIPGNDLFPLLRKTGTSDATRVLEAEQAQAYGLDGFQVWPSFAAAERWIDGLDRAGMGPDFKIMPQLAGSANFYPTYDAMKTGLRDFLVRYGDNPRIARLDGKALISTWGWQPYYADIPRMRDELAAEGLHFAWIPTTTRSFPGSLPYQSADGTNCWYRDQYPEGIESNLRNAEKVGNGFLIQGTIRAGYDNGQRIFTHDVTPYRGMKTLLESLNAGLDTGLRELILVTWNDISETAAFPSWASPYGIQEIMKYYRSLYAGKPPRNAEAQIVVAYPPDLLLGDNCEIQLLLLAGTNDGADQWQGRIRLEDSHGQTVWEQSVSLQATDDRRPRLAPFTYQVDLDKPIPVALSPIITDAQGVEKRLAPINIRVGRPRSFRPIIVALDKIAAIDPEMKVVPLNLPGVPVQPVQVHYTVDAPSPITQMQIMDGMIVLDDVQTNGDQNRFYLGLDNWGLRSPLELTLHGAGQWLWFYHSAQNPAITLAEAKPSGTDGAEASWGNSLETADAPHISVPIAVEQAVSVRRDTPVAVVALSADKVEDVLIEISSSDLDDGKPIEFTLEDLFAENIIFEGSEPDTSLRMRLMEDGHVLSRTPELNTRRLSGSAILPAIQRNEPYRILHLAGQLADGSIFYSRPYLWIRVPEEERSEERIVPVLVSDTTFDDGAGSGGVEVTLNEGGFEVAEPVYTIAPVRPYTDKTIHEIILPAWRVTDVVLPMNKGKGWMVGESDSYMSLGWAWRSGVMDRPAAKWVGPGPEDSQWAYDEASDRYVLDFSPTSRLSLRSRSGLSGAYTLSFDLKLDDLGGTQRLVSDTDVSGSKGPLQLFVLPDGRLKVVRDVSRQDPYSLVSSTKLSAGTWHRVTLVYDFTQISLAIDGKTAGSIPAPPEIVRSHSVPYIGAVSPEKADGFAGQMTNFRWLTGEPFNEQ